MIYDSLPLCLAILNKNLYLVSVATFLDKIISNIIIVLFVILLTNKICSNTYYLEYELHQFNQMIHLLIVR